MFTMAQTLNVYFIYFSEENKESQNICLKAGKGGRVRHVQTKWNSVKLCVEFIQSGKQREFLY